MVAGIVVLVVRGWVLDEPKEDSSGQTEELMYEGDLALDAWCDAGDVIALDRSYCFDGLEGGLGRP